MYTTELNSVSCHSYLEGELLGDLSLETFGARYADMGTGSHLCQGKHLCICTVWVWRRCNSDVFLLNTIEVFAPQCLLLSVCLSQGHTRLCTISVFKNGAKEGKEWSTGG